MVAAAVLPTVTVSVGIAVLCCASCSLVILVWMKCWALRVAGRARLKKGLRAKRRSARMDGQGMLNTFAHVIWDLEQQHIGTYFRDGGEFNIDFASDEATHGQWSTAAKELGLWTDGISTWDKDESEEDAIPAEAPVSGLLLPYMAEEDTWAHFADSLGMSRGDPGRIENRHCFEACPRTPGLIPRVCDDRAFEEDAIPVEAPVSEVLLRYMT